MNRTLLPLLSLFAACNVPHVIGENENHQGAITCASTVCNGTTVCVDDVCVQPSSSQCGGFGGLQCPTGQRCVDDPRDGCTWGTDPDCGGVCVAAPTDGGTTNPPDGGTTHPQSCGGFAGLQCESGYVCVDDPSDSCDPNNGGADCIGICQLDPNALVMCGGLTPFPASCAAGSICVDNPGHPSMAVDGTGICIKKLSCGGLAGTSCPAGMSCVDDLADSCDPNHGGADCPGVCVLPSTASHCGGFPGLSCTGGLRCVDDPADNCDPNHGGADCPGVCVP